MPDIKPTDKPGLYALPKRLSHPKVLITRRFAAFARRNRDRKMGRLLRLLW